MKKEIKLLDGSLSYPLEKQGYNLNKKLWTGDALINDPSAIKKIHKDYLVAGVDFISTSTYQISYRVLKEMGYNLNEIKDIFKRSVDLVQDAIEETKIKRKVKIVGSYGPFTLAMILGIVALILMILATKSNSSIIPSSFIS